MARVRLLRDLFTVAGVPYQSKKAAIYEAKLIRHQRGTPDLPLKSDDRDYVLALFREHYVNWYSWKERKDHPPFVRVVLREVKKGNRYFEFQREDGTGDGASLRVVENPSLAASSAMTREALREEIRPQVGAYRGHYFDVYGDSNGYAPSELSGLPMLPSECHVDHFPSSFEGVVKDFLQLEGLILDDVETTHPRESSSNRRVLVDRELAERWCAYHAEAAHYRCITSQEHVGRHHA
jgi:hypothetical protein